MNADKMSQEAYEGLDFASALSAHQAWRKLLLDLLADPDKEGFPDAATVGRDDCCTLGRWLHGDGKARFGVGPQFGTLLEEHRAFHHTAGQIVVQLQARKLDEASRLIAGPFAEHSGRIEALLSRSIHLRERSEPDEDGRPAPWLLLAFVVAMLVWVIWFLGHETGTDLAQSGDQRTASALKAPPRTVDGGQIFAGNCAACHQPTGLGVPGAFPPLAGSEYVQGPPERVARILLWGINGALTVKGQAYQGAMPAWSGILDDAQIAAVASYIRSQWGNAQPGLSASLVTAQRAAARSAPLTSADLDAH